MSDGSPEESVRRFGQKVAQMRTRRNLCRRQLTLRILRRLPTSDARADRLGESFIIRLESGRVVRINRSEINLIISALECTPAERNDLLLAADRNPLLQEYEEPTATIRAVNRFMTEFHDAVEEVVGNIQGVNADRLTNEQWSVIFDQAMQVIVRYKRRHG